MQKSKKILIVDDNETFLDLLKYTLKVSGYGVETASDGISGLEKLEEDSFDLLITDNHMPRMGGLELIDELSKRELDIKTLLISGDLTRDIVEEAKSKGVFSCLAKPFSINILRETLLKAFEGEEEANRKYTLDQQPQLLEAATL